MRCCSLDLSVGIRQGLRTLRLSVFGHVSPFSQSPLFAFFHDASLVVLNFVAADYELDARPDVARELGLGGLVSCCCSLPNSRLADPVAADQYRLPQRPLESDHLSETTDVYDFLSVCASPDRRHKSHRRANSDESCPLLELPHPDRTCQNFRHL